MTVKLYFVIDKEVTDEEFALVMTQLPFRHAKEFSATKLVGGRQVPVSVLDTTKVPLPPPVIVKNPPAPPAHIVRPRRKRRKWVEIYKEAFEATKLARPKYSNALEILMMEYAWEEEDVINWTVVSPEDLSGKLNLSPFDVRILMKHLLQNMGRRDCYTMAGIKMPKTVEDVLQEEAVHQELVHAINKNETGDEHLGFGDKKAPSIKDTPLDMTLMRRAYDKMDWDKLEETTYAEFLTALGQYPSRGNIVSVAKFFASMGKHAGQTGRQKLVNGHRANILMLPKVPILD